METKVASVEPLSRKDLVIGTGIATAMATTFALVSSGLSLIVTFVPGVVFAWSTYVWVQAKRTKAPTSTDFFPLYFAALAVQFIHFAEEFTTGFSATFPLLYGGAPYSTNLFVTFNMISYAVFTLSCLLFTKRLRFLMVPVLFFIIYGAIGNAIAHTWWSLYLQAYFPGLITAQLYWVVGPLVLYKLLGSRKAVIATIVLFAVVLITLLSVFASPAALSTQ